MSDERKEAEQVDPPARVVSLDAAAHLSWDLVKIVRELSVEDQQRVLEFAKSLMPNAKT